MSGVVCERFPACGVSTNNATVPKCDKPDCPGAREFIQRENPFRFLHIMPKADACDHDFQGWRTFDDGHGGEQVCTKCGMGAMAYTLATGI